MAVPSEMAVRVDISPADEEKADQPVTDPAPEPGCWKRFGAALKKAPITPTRYSDFLLDHVHKDLYTLIIAFTFVCLASVVVVPVFVAYKATGEAAVGRQSYCAIQQTYSQATCDEYFGYFPWERNEIDSPGLIHFQTTVRLVNALCYCWPTLQNCDSAGRH